MDKIIKFLTKIVLIRLHCLNNNPPFVITNIQTRGGRGRARGYDGGSNKIYEPLFASKHEHSQIFSFFRETFNLPRAFDRLLQVSFSSDPH